MIYPVYHNRATVANGFLVCYNENEVNKMQHSTYAAELFVKGYNCAQAVAVAFCDLTGMEPDYAAKLASSFGGGMGGMREVCGAVSGMLMVAGVLYGYDNINDAEAKKSHYALVQTLAEQFREQSGSIICRELLKNLSVGAVPSARTSQYYKERPCTRLVELAAEILDKYIAEHPVK